MVGGQRTVLKRGTMIHGPSPPTQLNPKNYIDRTYRPAVELSLMCCKLPFMCFLWTFRCFHRGLRFYEINSSFLDALFAINFSTIVLLQQQFCKLFILSCIFDTKLWQPCMLHIQVAHIRVWLSHTQDLPSSDTGTSCDLFSVGKT